MWYEWGFISFRSTANAACRAADTSPTGGGGEWRRATSSTSDGVQRGPAASAACRLRPLPLHRRPTATPPGRPPASRPRHRQDLVSEQASCWQEGEWSPQRAGAKTDGWGSLRPPHCRQNDDFTMRTNHQALFTSHEDVCVSQYACQELSLVKFSSVSAMRTRLYAALNLVQKPQ